MIAEESNHPNVRVAADDVGSSSTALRDAGLQRLNIAAFMEAIALLGRAAALDPEDPQTQLGLGVALQRAGRHADALAPLERARKSLSKDPLPPFHTSLSLLALGKAELALQAASDACALASSLAQAPLAYGQALLALNEPVRAEQAFMAALRHAPHWADAWVLCGDARRRQGAIEAAKAAIREALRLAPAHKAAATHLAALERFGTAPEESLSDRSGFSQDLGDWKPATDQVALTAWRPKSPAASIGLAVEYLSKKPAFARLPFGDWSQSLFYQVAREHFLFVIDQDRRIRGFLGWALTEERLAELWVEGRSGLKNEECLAGDCVIVNAWSADTPGVNRFLLEAMRKLFGDRRAIYFKRHYPDGRERPMRLVVPAHLMVNKN